jgi:hypothetical protein
VLEAEKEAARESARRRAQELAAARRSGIAPGRTLADPTLTKIDEDAWQKRPPVLTCPQADLPVGAKRSVPPGHMPAKEPTSIALEAAFKQRDRQLVSSNPIEPHSCGARARRPAKCL